MKKVNLQLPGQYQSENIGLKRSEKHLFGAGTDQISSRYHGYRSQQARTLPKTASCIYEDRTAQAGVTGLYGPGRSTYDKTRECQRYAQIAQRQKLR